MIISSCGYFCSFTGRNMSRSIKRMRQNLKNIPTVMPGGIPVSKCHPWLTPEGAEECPQCAEVTPVTVTAPSSLALLPRSENGSIPCFWWVSCVLIHSCSGGWGMSDHPLTPASQTGAGVSDYKLTFFLSQSSWSAQQFQWPSATLPDEVRYL